ncbi:MAG TPA: DNA topoisomerase IB, partial [Cellulomonas sp.]|nr:DNA topoisomerase IB [Cellulomonas sp.]
MVRLRRVRIDAPGWTRRRQGRAFVYLDVDRVRIEDDEHLARIVALAIPPAWSDVWISPWPNGHIQAAGLDVAARRQYLYHQQWRLRRDRLKHDHVLDVAERLPAA